MSRSLAARSPGILFLARCKSCRLSRSQPSENILIIIITISLCAARKLIRNPKSRIQTHRPMPLPPGNDHFLTSQSCFLPVVCDGQLSRVAFSFMRAIGHFSVQWTVIINYCGRFRHQSSRFSRTCCSVLTMDNSDKRGAIYLSISLQFHCVLFF